MTLDEMKDYSDLLVLGVLDAEERAELRAAVARDPEAARTVMRSSAGLVTQLSGVVKLMDPPARLRSRVIGLVLPAGELKEKRSVFGWGLVFASSSVMLLALAGLLAYQINRLSLARRADNARFASAAALMAAPDTREVTFGTGKPKPPQGRVFLNGKGLVLIASNLATLGADKTYEMWVIPKGKNPVPAGLFRARDDGSALHYEERPVNIADVSAVAVSVEPLAGSAQPSTTPIIVAAMAL